MTDIKMKKQKKTIPVNEMTKGQLLLRNMRVNKVGYAMVFPFMLLFTVFTVFPVVLSLILSFTEFNMIEFPKWLGIDNYVRLILDDDVFLIGIKNTLIFAAITGPASYLMSLFIAWFINDMHPKLRAIVTFIFYSPSISGQLYLIFTILFSGDQYGVVNSLLLEMSIITEPINFFFDSGYIMPLVIVVALWTSLGTSFLSFIAGLQGVDRSLYEAGAVDGLKNRWQELWYITLPSMREQLMFGAVMSITQAFSFGGIITALCGFPSTEYTAWTIMHHLEDYGGQRFETGYASAIATILFIMMVGSNFLIKRILGKVGK